MAETSRGLSILDDVAAMARADEAGMLAHLAAFPERVAEGRRLVRDLELPWATPRSVAILGMGGSAIGGDLATAIWADRISVPVAVLRGYELPAWVGPETLVIASSKSGDTEETLRQLETALGRRCPVVCVSTGGALRRVAEAARLPHVTFPDVGAPRAALGWSVAIVAGILEKAGLLELDEADIEAGIAAARDTATACGPAVPTADNAAKRLAWSLVDRLVLVSASGFLAPVARRWKTQLNENAKTAAVFDELPEAAHNTIVGLEQPESLRDHLAVVFLRSDLEHPRNALRAQLMGDVMDTGHVWHTAVDASGDGRLAHALGLVVLGDYVSAYLAFMYAVDPSPVVAIDHIKAQLALADQPGDR
jgi:glucose/mannose-6-phosphate isomerase